MTMSTLDYSQESGELELSRENVAIVLYVMYKWGTYMEYPNCENSEEKTIISILMTHNLNHWTKFQGGIRKLHNA